MIRYDAKGRADARDDESEYRNQDREIEECIGGLRRAARGVSKIARCRASGDLLRSTLGGVIRKHVLELDTLHNELGNEQCARVRRPLI